MSEPAKAAPHCLITGATSRTRSRSGPFEPKKVPAKTMPLRPSPNASHLRLVPHEPRATAIRALLVGRRDDAGDAVQGWIARLGATAVQIGEKHLPYEWLDQYAASFDIALVDADHLGDAGDMIDFGQRLRRHAPGLPVIMATSHATSDDLTTERMAFCDATLKKPLTTQRLERAAAHAAQNHARWLETREALRPPARLLGAIP